MIQRFRNSRTFKGMAILVILSIVSEIVSPTMTWALTGGPSQPEFSSFTPIGISDMVDLSSGDMNYNIPLMDVGGYPLNISYNAGSGMDQEASWVGLGWDLSVGQISRNVRGIPDDFKGDAMQYENHLRPNITAGVDIQLNPALAGADFLDLSLGAALTFNNYTGFSMSPSVGIGLDLGTNASIGFNVKSGEDGLTVSPNLSVHAQANTKKHRTNTLGASVGVSWNSRNGVSQMTMGVSSKTEFDKSAKNRTNSGAQRMNGSGSLGSHISFAEQLYTPSRRVGMETGSFTVNAAFGGEIYTVEVQGQVTAYGTIMAVKQSERNKLVSAYGYANTEYATEYGQLDFNREKDGNFSVSSNNLPVTNYTYDVYSVQGQGVGGTYRPFRNQVGYVYDARVEDGSLSGQAGFEVGAGNMLHAGVDIEATDVESHSGVWSNNNGIIGNLQEQDYGVANYERVHFKNVGDLSSDKDPLVFSNVGEYSAVRVPYSGGEYNRTADSKLIRKIYGNTESTLAVNGPIQRTQRQARNQTIHNLTLAEVQSGIGYGPVARGEVSLSVGKPHHIAEVQIIRNDGARYIYGLPAYNVRKRETTFAVNNGDCITGISTYAPSSLDNPGDLPNDQYLERITTPEYVHTHLLTSVLSTDYSDLDGNGPTPDDYGSYTKFSYRKYSEMPGASGDVYRWRVPYYANTATYNEGIKTDPDDDQASYTYGEKEMYYIKTIETKTHIAVFELSPRKDARGVQGEQGGAPSNPDDQRSYKLDKISLYSVGEYYLPNGQINSGATPIKEVNFEYSYSLCPGVDNNSGGTTNELSNFGGKLTLKKIYFTYRNSKMGKYTGYTFNYNEFVGGLDEYSNPNLAGLTLNTNGVNPAYHIKGYDSWGNYMPQAGANCNNNGLPTTSEFHFTDQNRAVQDIRSQAWNLQTIKLPSGGQISMEYESDSYKYVQDKPVNQMFKVMGAGDDLFGTAYINANASNAASELYGMSLSNSPRQYLYVQIDENGNGPVLDPADFLPESTDDLIQFRFFLNMTNLGALPGSDNTAHFDYVSGYFQIDEALQPVGFNTTSGRYLSIPVRYVEKEGGISGNADVHPIAKAGWHYARKFLSKYAYGLQPNTNSDVIEDIVNEMVSSSVISNLSEIITGPNGALENKGVARRFMKEKSWIRLLKPGAEKLGGGCRVASVRMSDVWDEMTEGVGYQTMNYGQEYVYTLSGNKFENGQRAETSGVATYEPIGNKENPFVQPVYSRVEKLLAPDEENFVEGPFGESFFPSPTITYSKVSVRSLKGGVNNNAPDVKQLHKTGSVVTEFYTSKDYPTIVNQTTLQDDEDKASALESFLSMNIRKHMTMSQGYVIHLNDMNGKQKSQRVYAEGQSAAISGVDYKYDNHASSPGFNAAGDPDQDKGKLNNLVPVIHPNGTISNETIGVETDVVVDLRENASKTYIAGVNTNLASFLASVVPIAIPIPLPDYSQNEDQFRSVSMTKVINTFGILKETVAYDAGAAVYTRNLAWDSETGEVLVTETIDEFNEKYYTLNYPAHWYYDGMAQASRNIGMTGTMQSISAGVFSSPSGNFLLPGDELAIFYLGNTYQGWVTQGGTVFNLIDANGSPLVVAGQSTFKVVRSGHRNLQSAGIMNITLMENPLSAGYISSSYLISNNWDEYRIINAGAVDYSDEWGLACECGMNNGISIYNPYVRNERGVWRTKSSRTYLTGRNSKEELLAQNGSADLTPRRQGFFTTFRPMYVNNGLSGWLKDFTDWTFVAEVSNYSPYGFELENKDALNRYSSAQYGYNNTFPMAVGANTKYNELGFDGFEDYNFAGCPYSDHFKFQGDNVVISPQESHTGKHSIKVSGNSRATMKKKLACDTQGNNDPELPE